MSFCLLPQCRVRERCVNDTRGFFFFFFKKKNIHGKKKLQDDMPYLLIRKNITEDKTSLFFIRNKDFCILVIGFHSYMHFQCSFKNCSSGSKPSNGLKLINSPQIHKVGIKNCRKESDSLIGLLEASVDNRKAQLTAPSS